MIVRLTQDHIEAAVLAVAQNLPRVLHCPIEQATQEATGRSADSLAVTGAAIIVSGDRTDRNIPARYYRLPPEAVAHARAFDNYRVVRPLEFEVEGLEAEVIQQKGK